MILIIDDTAIFREPIAACLRLAGLDAVCAADGMDGLARARQRKPQLILLDMAMPRMDGLSVLQVLQSDPQLNDVPVIALTAVAEKDYMLRARELNVREYLLKSRFHASELVERIRKHAAA